MDENLVFRQDMQTLFLLCFSYLCPFQNTEP